MSSFLKFEIRRGDEDSSDIEDLGFYVLSAGLENSLLKFDLEFDNPQQISIGSLKDVMITTIVDGSFFSSSENGLSIEPGT